MIWKGKSLRNMGLKICIFMYSRAWLAHPLRWLPLACQENVALPILRPLAHWLMRNTHNWNFSEIFPQWTSLQWKRVPCLPVIYPSSNVIENVLHAKEYQIRKFRDNFYMTLLFIHVTVSRIWVPIPLCTKDVSPFPSSVIRSNVSGVDSYHFITGETRVQYQANVCQICGGNLTLMQLPLRGIRFSPVIVIPPMTHHVHSLISNWVCL